MPPCLLSTITQLHDTAVAITQALPKPGAKRPPLAVSQMSDTPLDPSRPAMHRCTLAGLEWHYRISAGQPGLSLCCGVGLALLSSLKAWPEAHRVVRNSESRMRLTGLAPSAL